MTNIKHVMLTLTVLLGAATPNNLAGDSHPRYDIEYYNKTVGYLQTSDAQDDELEFKVGVDLSLF